MNFLLRLFIVGCLAPLIDSACSTTSAQGVAESGSNAPVSGQPQVSASTNYVGRSTNGPVVFDLFQVTRLTPEPNPQYRRNQELLKSTNLPPIVRERLLQRKVAETVTNLFRYTNSQFVAFLPKSLNNEVLTNVIASTNGREMKIWSQRNHPAAWPLTAPEVTWNHKSLLWGMRGFTALSPCWELEGSSGQVPITALTRRHGYTRGHGMGEEGFRTHYAGKKVWFVTPTDEVVEMRIAREVVRGRFGQDYTIVLFTKDLPESVEPLPVVSTTDLSKHYPSSSQAPWPLYMAEQLGNVSTGLIGFSCPVVKGGDSGSPSMLPLHNELVFVGGRTTSAPSKEMQDDMDELCRTEGLNPRKYQMRWVDLSRYPAY